MAGNRQAVNRCMQQSMIQTLYLQRARHSGRCREADLNRRSLSVGGFEDSGTAPAPISTPHYEVPTLMAPVTKAGWPCACKGRFLLASSHACSLSNELFVHGELPQETCFRSRLRHMSSKYRQSITGMRTLWNKDAMMTQRTSCKLVVS